MRALLELHMRRSGKETGADNKANVERALALYEAVLPRGRTTPVTRISLKEWNEVYDFFVKIPASRGQQVDDLAGHTRRMIASGESYQTLSPTTLNSNYLGALTRLINFGKNQRQFLMTTPNLLSRSEISWRSTEMAHEVSLHVHRALSFYAKQVKSVYGDDVVSLVLFGSQARGEAGQNSDIDVGVIFKSIIDRRAVRDRLAELAYGVLLAYGEDIQAVAIAREQWDFPETFTNPSLIQAIKRDRIFFG